MRPYALARFLVDGAPRVAVVVDERAVLLDESDVNGLIAGFADARLAVTDAVDQAPAEGIPVDGLVLLSPAVPRQVLQAGANYRTHVLDLAVAHAADGDVEKARSIAVAEMDRQERDGRAYIFIGLSTIVASPADPLVLPASSDSHDWELELAAVIGTEGYQLTRDEALDHVFGYTIVNDITTREFVMRTDIPTLGADWFRSKNAPGFLPTGPYIVPREFVPDPQDLRVRLDVNGVTRQDERTADMIVDVAAIVAAASQTARLLPGDLILTGSPAGNGKHYGIALKPGDEMVGSITGLGVQKVRCVAP